jgi:hypothetical protein
LQGQVRPSALGIDFDQFSEPLPAAAAAAEVDPFECCASTDPSAPPEAVWLPAVTL